MRKLGANEVFIGFHHSVITHIDIFDSAEKTMFERPHLSGKNFVSI